jgi:hypothetical protein
MPDTAPILPAADTLALTENTNIVLEGLPDGKIRATSRAWDEAKVLQPNQVLEVRSMGLGKRLRVAVKDRFPDAKDPPVVPVHGCYDFVDDTAAAIPMVAPGGTSSGKTL